MLTAEEILNLIKKAEADYLEALYEEKIKKDGAHDRTRALNSLQGHDHGICFERIGDSDTIIIWDAQNQDPSEGDFLTSNMDEDEINKILRKYFNGED